MLVCIVIAFWHGQVLSNPPANEYTLKAALIYKLSKFVEWPDTVSPASGERRNFGICLLGDDAFGDALDALEGKTVGGQPVHVQKFIQSESIGNSCQVLFISESKRPFLSAIFQLLRNKPILVMGDSEGFADGGGIIEFTTANKSMGFKINLASSRASGLKIAAPLLEVATLIDSPGGGASP